MVQMAIVPATAGVAHGGRSDYPMILGEPID